MRANVQVLIADIKQFMNDYPESTFNDYLRTLVYIAPKMKLKKVIILRL